MWTFLTLLRYLLCNLFELNASSRLYEAWTTFGACPLGFQLGRHLAFFGDLLYRLDFILILELQEGNFISTFMRVFSLTLQNGLYFLNEPVLR